MTGRLHVWMPTIRGYSGGDVFVERLASGLRGRGGTVTVDWFDRRYEGMPGLLSRKRVPEGVNLIHANGLDGFAFRRHEQPLVVTEHHYVLDPAYRPHKSALQHFYHRAVTGRASLRSMHAADAITTHSAFVASTVVAACPLAKPVVIPLWVDLDVFSPRLGGRPNGAPFSLLFVGNTSRRKGFDVVVALARRLDGVAQIRCTGGLRGGNGSTLPANMSFLGRLSPAELVAAYQACDAALVPSRYEGFGYSALEAMACARPVVGFACGSVEEIVEDGKSGFLVPVDDVDGLEQRIRKLVADGALARRMGEAGRDRAERVFSADRGIDAYIDVYGNALRAR